MHQTKADYAAARIREALSSGRFVAGERLQPRDLAKELGLSLTPVREALIELAAEGLIDMRPHRGPHVATTELESLTDLYLVREMLEGLAVQLAATRITAEERATLREIHAQFVDALHRGAIDRLADLSDQFHLVIYTAAKSPLLLRAIKMVLGSAPSGILTSIPGRAERSLTDHENLLAAIESGDGDRAAEVMRVHLHDSLAFVEQFRQTGPAKAPRPRRSATRSAADDERKATGRANGERKTGGRTAASRKPRKPRA